MVELAGGSRVERVVLYGTEQGNDLQHKRRAVVVLLGLVAASACVALLGMVWPSVVPGTETELQVSADRPVQLGQRSGTSHYIARTRPLVVIVTALWSC